MADWQGAFSNCWLVCVDEERVSILRDFGYPRDYVLMSVSENEANFCLSGYYLLAIDQNY